MSLGAPPSFSALVSPSGIHAVEFRSSRRGMRIVRSALERGAGWDAPEAAGRLCGLLEAMGGRGGRVHVAAKGFGSYHHILSLPAAPREILLPVATREMRRFYPDLFHEGRPSPLIDFVEIDSTGQGSGGSSRELLVAGAPREMVETFARALRARGMRLEHWTILPLVVQRLFETFVRAPDSRAVLLLIPGDPLLGFFHGGELRLFSEARAFGAAPEAVRDATVEQIRRGELFLRQQFRGARLSRVHLAVEAEDRKPGFVESLQQRLELPVEPLGPGTESAGTLAALGAALDARSGRGLNLLPAALRPPPAAERWARSLAVASVAVLVLAGAWWAWRGVQAETAAAREVRELQESVRRRSAGFAAARAVVEQRRAHAQRTELLSSVRSEREVLLDLLWPLRAAPGLRVDDLRLDRSEGAWGGTLVGTATAPTSQAATAQVNALLGDLALALPAHRVVLQRLAYGAPGAAAGTAAGDQDVALSFQIVFIGQPSPQGAP